MGSKRFEQSLKLYNFFSIMVITGLDDQGLWYVLSYSRGMHYNKSGGTTIICKEHHTYLLWSAIMVSVNTIERFFAHTAVLHFHFVAGPGIGFFHPITIEQCTLSLTTIYSGGRDSFWGTEWRNCSGSEAFVSSIKRYNKSSICVGIFG